jgi:C-terminal peptidase prc
MHVKTFLILSLLLAKFALSNPLCVAHYSPDKEELAIIFNSLSVHVEKKQITKDLTHKAILYFTEIIDPNKVLFYQHEIQELKELSKENVNSVHSQVFSSYQRNFHQSLQKEAFSRLWFLISSVKNIKDVRNEILRRIPLIDLKNIEPRLTTYPKDQPEALNYFMNYMAESAAALKKIAASEGQYALTDKEALMMSIRMIRNELTTESYLYNPAFLPKIIAKSYIDKLDAHSYLFLPKEKSSFFNGFLRGEFYGLGIAGLPSFKGLEILSVNKESGAEVAGLVSGDIITHIKTDKEQKENLIFARPPSKSEWTLIRNIDNQILFHQILPGKENSSISVRVLRDGKYIEKTIQRKLITKGETAITLNIHTTEQGNIAHIEFDSFYENSAKQLADKIREAQRSKAKGLILDLRGNGGGSTLEMMRILGLFVHEGPAMVIKSSSTNEVESIQPPTGIDRQAIWTKPLIVLTDKYSASASEGLSGALKDYGRAIIVGADNTTYGKGSMQRIFNLDPSVSVKVTTHLFSSPNGSHRQFDGVTPDIVIKTAEDKSFKFERDLEGAIQPNEDMNYLDNNTPLITNKDEVVKKLKASALKLQKQKLKEKTTDQKPKDPVKEITLELMTEFIDLQNR